jgi:hypothetical protein
MITYNEIDYTWADAVSEGIVNNYIFGWDRDTQSYNIADTLEPGYAYWLYSYYPCILKT